MTTLAPEFPVLLADRAVAAAELAALSDVELLQRFPTLTVAAVALLVAGLASDAYLLWHFNRRRGATVSQVAVKPWGLHELGLLVVAFFSLNTLLLLAAQWVGGNENQLWVFILAGNSAVNVALLLLIAVYLRVRRLDWREMFGFDTGLRLPALGWGALLFLAMLPPLYLVSGFYAALCYFFQVQITQQPIVELLALTDSRWVLGLVVALAVLVAPVFEEVVFRGVAYPALKQRWGRWRALVVVALLFALIHSHAPSAGSLFALGIMFGLAYELTGSLLTPIVMHALFNGINVAMLLYVRAQT